MASIRKYDQDVTVSLKLRTVSAFWCCGSFSFYILKVAVIVLNKQRWQNGFAHLHNENFLCG
jgi:hypothetical protein